METVSQNPPPPPLKCAVEILEVMPVIMGSLRCEMRRDPSNTLTMVQFRVLAFLDRRGNASLSQTADNLGLGLPCTSKIVDGLVQAGSVERQADPADRRRISLQLSEAGRKELRATRAIAQGHLARMLSSLGDAERTLLLEAMQSLHSLVLQPPQPPQS